MRRSELEARLRELTDDVARVMAVVNEYVAALSPGPSATRYRRGSIIRQTLPHPGHLTGARRWRVWDVEGNDYLVQALFSDGSPMVARWNVSWCEAITELEWQNDEVGRIGPTGLCEPEEEGER